MRWCDSIRELLCVVANVASLFDTFAAFGLSCKPAHARDFGALFLSQVLGAIGATFARASRTHHAGGLAAFAFLAALGFEDAGSLANFFFAGPDNLVGTGVFGFSVLRLLGCFTTSWRVAFVLEAAGAAVFFPFVFAVAEVFWLGLVVFFM
jgi:hypothetical protein